MRRHILCGKKYISTCRNLKNEQGFTKPTFAQQGKGVFQRSCLPASLGEIVVQELQHKPLLFVPRCLSPQSVHKFYFPQGKVEQATLRWISIVARQELIASDVLHVSFLRFRFLSAPKQK